jgi:hypothetical protein
MAQLLIVSMLERLVKNCGNAYLEQQLRMAVGNGTSSAAIKSETLHSLLELMELLSKVQSSDKHFIPSTLISNT